MIKRRTWVFVALFGLVLLGSVLLRRPMQVDTPSATAEEPSALWSVSGSEIEIIRVEDFMADREIEVRRDEEKLWWMVRPEERAVDAARVERAVSWLIAPRPLSEIGLAEDLTPYGLGEQPSFRVTIELSDESQKSFEVGRFSPTGGSRYVSVPGRSSLVLISDFGLNEVLDLFDDLQPTPTLEITPTP